MFNPLTSGGFKQKHFAVSHPGDSVQVEGEHVRIHSDEISIKLLQTHRDTRQHLEHAFNLVSECPEKQTAFQSILFPKQRHESLVHLIPKTD